jgi:mannan endo-1,4-beta-mannosidase
VLFVGCTPAEKKPDFVKVEGNQFTRDGSPYRYMGANYWQGMNLGMSGADGNRERLMRELDQMKSVGINNLRIMAITEGPDGSLYRVNPSSQNEKGRLREEVLVGLDFLLSEMQKRDMTAIVVMNNFWQWSGGFSQYVLWNKGGDSIPYPPPHANGDWGKFQNFSAHFYTIPDAITQYHGVVKQLINRVNTITKVPYKEDPTIMAWQLANEPRGDAYPDAMQKWIDETASLIKQEDTKHLVSTGSEGDTPTPGPNGMDFEKNHSSKNVDYTTIHIWIQNWSWYDPAKHDSTYPGAKQKMLDYLNSHAVRAKQMNKPLVLEEFGIMKDGGSFEPSANTINRDQYYSDVFNAVFSLMQKNEASGVNFWAWGGEGRPREPAAWWKKGDDLLGDPPHEPQGWYSVYNTDSSTHKVIKGFAGKIYSLK